MTNSKNQPADRITINVRLPGEADFKDHEIFMSAGLIRTLVNYANTVEDHSQLYTNPTLQEIMMIEALVGRNNRGEADTAELSLMDFGLSINESDKLMNWITEHVLDFFTRSIERLTESAKTPEGAIQRLMESLSGIQALAEKKASVGPTDVKEVKS